MEQGMSALSGMEPHQVKAVVKQSYCYVLLYRGVVVYVGETSDIDARMALHAKEKIFDEVKRLLVPENTKPARLAKENELKDLLNPVFISRTGRREVEKLRQVDDAIFLPKIKRCFYLQGEELFDPMRNEVGYVIDGVMNFIAGDWIYRYDTRTGKLEEKKYWSFARKDKVGLSDFVHVEAENRMYFGPDFQRMIEDQQQKKARQVKRKEKKEYRESLEVVVNNEGRRLPEDYIFHFGRHNGVQLQVVKMIDPTYVTWFERNVPHVQWIKNPI